MEVVVEVDDVDVDVGELLEVDSIAAAVDVVDSAPVVVTGS